MNHVLRAVIITLAWTAAGCIAAMAQATEPPPDKSAAPMSTDSRRSLDEAALTRRIEEYSDSKKGEERLTEDRQARAVVKRFVAALAALVANDPRAMLTESSLPWLDRAELLRDEPAGKRRLAECRFPDAFARGDTRITLLNSLEELEQALGKKVPDGARKTWADHLAAGSRIAVVEGGTMLLGLSVRRTKDEYSVSGLLFDYFPKPDDPLLRVITTTPIAPP